MLLLILNFLRQHIVAVVEAFLVVVLFFQHAEITHQKGALMACKNDNLMLSADNASLASLIERQDAAIEALKVASDKKHKAAVQSLARAKAEAGKYAAHAQYIQSQSVTDECEGMRDLLNHYFKR